MSAQSRLPRPEGPQPHSKSMGQQREKPQIRQECVPESRESCVRGVDHQRLRLSLVCQTW